MASQTQKHKGKYLWFCLLGLGFEPTFSTVSKTASKHTNLGPNMFDKPNKDAFHVVIQFLLEKLDPTRFQQTYKFCLPSLTSKQDAEFRKLTCAWLRDIMVETGYPGSKVLASLLLSPGGLKFVSLMVHLALHVMQQEMKTFTTDESWVPDAAWKPTSSYNMAVKRLHVAKKKLLKEMTHRHRFYLEAQEKTQSVLNSLRDLTAEHKKYDELLQKCDAESVQEESADKPETVRSLWANVDGMLSATERDRNVLESVLEGEVDQYALDGAGRSLQISHSLLERMAESSQQLTSGAAYEAGQLKLLCPLELMTHSLRLLKEEMRGGLPQLSLSQLQQKQQQVAHQLQELELLRLKISKEEIPELMNGIKQLEEELDRKWACTSLVPLVNDEPALGFLSPLARLSFQAASDTSSVFSQFPAKLPEKSLECHLAEAESNTSTDLKSDGRPAAEECPQGGGATDAESPRADSSLNWLLHTPPPPSPPQETSPQLQQIAVRMTSLSPSKATKKPTLDMECDNLADQFADAVTATSPTDGGPAGLELEGILNILHGDPFSTRKQIPRTPESLIQDVKNSWQKALEEDDAKKHDGSISGHLSPLGEPCGDGARQPGSSHANPTDNRRSFWSTLDTASPLSLQQETLPELPSCDSLLSLGDDEEIPNSGGSPKRLLSPCDVSALSAERASVPAVFSLDIDALDKTSPLKKLESLPPLITFSPVDDKNF